MKIILALTSILFFLANSLPVQASTTEVSIKNIQTMFYIKMAMAINDDIRADIAYKYIKIINPVGDIRIERRVVDKQPVYYIKSKAFNNGEMSFLIIGNVDYQYNEILDKIEKSSFSKII